MKKNFENPVFEVVNFGGNDIVSASSTCCDVGGIQFPTNDAVCSYGDARCKCTDSDPLVNCTT